MKVKIFVVCILIAALAAIITGCGSAQNDETPSMNIDFVNGQTVYSGTEQHFYQVEEGNAGELKITVTRESGNLNISVFPVNDPQHYCYRGADLPSSVFTVTLPEPGKYKVFVEADKFAGSYGFDWTEK